MLLEPSPQRSDTSVPSTCWRISQSPPRPITRARPLGAPVDRSQNDTVPTSGGSKGTVVDAAPLVVPLVSRALLLPVQSLVQTALAPSVAVFPIPELSAAAVPEP